MFTNLLKLYNLTSLVLILLIWPEISKAEQGNYRFSDHLICDFHHFYSIELISQRAIGFAVGGYFANTDFDPEYRILWQNHLRNDFTNKLSGTVNDYGKIASYPVSVPLYAATLWITHAGFTTSPNTALGEWANHSLRTLLVGVPEQVLFTHLLGSGRPQSGQHRWDLFNQHRAVSGHAFYGAVPLINAAKQMENPFLRGTLYVLSTLPGLARINDDKHYFSQIWLGWWLAYSASKAVWYADRVSNKPNNLEVQLIPQENGIFLGMVKKF